MVSGVISAGIGVRRIRTFPFLTTPLTMIYILDPSTYVSLSSTCAEELWVEIGLKTRLSESEAEVEGYTNPDARSLAL